VRVVGMRLRLFCAGASLVAVVVPAGGAAAAARPVSATRSGMVITRSRHPGPSVDPLPVARHAHAVPSAGSPWQTLTHLPPFNPGAMILLTDGTVLVQSQGPMNQGSNQWWRLTPNATGSYVKGTWSKVASLPSSYAPLYFASAVLPDGRVIIMGGEYNHGKDVQTNQGAIYDPVANVWTTVHPPSGNGWTTIGDAPSTVLANGTFMLGASGIYGLKSEALLNEAKLTWQPTGSGKADGNPEQGWSLLPNGTVLTVDTENRPGNTEVYTPSTGSWKSTGLTPVPLVDTNGEIGPQILRPDGTVFAAGATGSNAIYNTATSTWSAGPKFPKVDKQQLDVADGPAAVLPDGDVLVAASPGEYTAPTRVFDFNGATLTQVPNPPNADFIASNYVFMMVLPTGQVLFNDRAGDIEVYNPSGAPNKAWLPSITAVRRTLSAGHTYTLSGKQLNGLTQASAYGDDYQSATNYPLVRLTNKATRAVFYARTHGMTKMSVAPRVSSSVSFTLPKRIPAGTYTLVVVANGLASARIVVKAT
jgi:hypothetical protein